MCLWTSSPHGEETYFLVRRSLNPINSPQPPAPPTTLYPPASTHHYLPTSLQPPTSTHHPLTTSLQPAASKCRCPACVRFQPHLDRLSAATQDIPLMVIKVSNQGQQSGEIPPNNGHQDQYLKIFPIMVVKVNTLEYSSTWPSRSII